MNTKTKKDIISLCEQYSVTRAFGNNGFACHGPTFHIFMQHRTDTHKSGLYLNYLSKDYETLYSTWTALSPQILDGIPEISEKVSIAAQYRMIMRNLVDWFSFDKDLYQDAHILQIYMAMRDKVARAEKAKANIPTR